MHIVCLLCGALVAEVPTHADWHGATILAVIGDQDPPPGVDPDADDTTEAHSGD